MKKIAVGIFVIVLFSIGCISVSAEYFICLGSFTVPENAADYQAELSAVGYRTFTDNAVVNGRLFTRILYRYPFQSYDNARATLKTLSQSRVILRNKIYDLWIVTTPDSVSQISSQSSPSEISAGNASVQTSSEREGVSSVAKTKSGTTEVGDQAHDSEEENGGSTHGGGKQSGGPVDDDEAESAAVPAGDDEDWNSVPGNPYKRIHSEGYANCIFAETPIGLGEEDRHQLKNSFIAPDDVYARCYLPGPIGPVEGDNFWHELWIDGKLRGRTFFKEPPEPEWDQIQIWITEDEYSSQMNELGTGKHDIIIWVMKNEYRGERAVAGENAADEMTAEMKEIWVPVRLSKGKFTYTVE